MSDEVQEMLTLPAFEQAAHKVREVTQETKLIESPHFSEIAGNRRLLQAGEHAAHRRLQGAWRILQDQHALRRRAQARSHHRVGRQPRAGSGLRGTALRRARHHRHARNDPLYQGGAHQSARR